MKDEIKDINEKVELDDTSNDDKDLDNFESFEEEETEGAKEEIKEKINWKKILPYVGVGIVCFLLGKKRRRFVPIDHIEFDGLNNISIEEKRGIDLYTNNLNKAFRDNAVVLCRDTKHKLSANLAYYE